MKRILAIDFGTKRMGFCISDPLGITVNPIENFSYENYDQVYEKIRDIILNYKDVEMILLGYPTRLTGTKSELTFLVEDFQKNLITKFPLIKIQFQSEILTTTKAKEILKSQNIKAKNIKNNLDKISSCVILKNYIDSTK